MRGSGAMSQEKTCLTLLHQDSYHRFSRKQGQRHGGGKCRDRACTSQAAANAVETKMPSLMGCSSVKTTVSPVIDTIEPVIDLSTCVL
jgi:hypothetical protein